MTILETERLRLRLLEVADADFLLKLLNEPAFLEHVGDRNLRTIAAVQEHIRTGPAASYAHNGFGLMLVGLKESGSPIGICGLIRRDWLEDVDLGYTYLERYWGKGYAYEAAAATLAYGRQVLGLSRMVAITSPGNGRSMRLLEKLGMHFERIVTGPTGAESRLFTTGPA